MANLPRGRASWIDLSADRLRLEIAGPDRAKFLHNLTTNDVKRLLEGSGQESFVTSPQGRTIAHVSLLAGAGSILLRTDAIADESLVPHLRKYGIFEDVAIEDASGRTFEYHLAGDGAASILADVALDLPDEGELRHRSTSWEGTDDVRVIRESTTGRPGFTLIGPATAAARLRSRLEAAGIAPMEPATFEALRIEAGMPISGRDVTPGNLPQEIGRDDRTINFVKGCYLGQETVARLDALGHVNRILRGLRVEGPTAPALGAPISFEGKAVGAITSAASSEGLRSAVALAYIKVAQAVPGTRLMVEVDGRDVVALVSGLPMIPDMGGEDPARGGVASP